MNEYIKTPITDYVDSLVEKGLKHNDAIELEKILEVLDMELIVRIIKQVQKTAKAANCKEAVAAKSLIQAGLDAPEDKVNIYVRFNKGDLK